MSEPEDDLSADPIALARLFVSGRMLKRGDTIRLVHDLLAILEQAPPPAPVLCIAQHEHGIPAGMPNIAGYDARAPIEVQGGVSGSVFLGPEANRYFTRSEAIALAGAIARTATR